MTAEEAHSSGKRAKGLSTTKRWRALGATGAVALVLGVVAPIVVGASAASADDAFHGLTPLKSCHSPVKIGSPYECSYKITNSDDNDENIVVSNVTDIVHSAGGDVNSGNIIDSLTWTLTAGATCTAPPNRTCTLPNSGSRMTSDFASFYTATPGDFALAGHVLHDNVHVIWAEPVCTLGGCPIGPQEGTTGASAIVQPLTPSITTQLSATAVQLGDTVTDQATLVGATANADGTVSYAVYSDVTCQTKVADLGTKAVSNGSVGPSDPYTADTEGDFWFQATYSGDPATGNVGPVSSTCESEPLTVTSTPPVTEGTTSTSLSPETTVAQAELPRTGGPQGPEALIALSLLVLGAGLWLFGSRIRSIAKR